MKSSKLFTAAVVIVTSMGLLTGLGLGDLDKKLSPNKEDCDKKADPKKCRKGEAIRGAATAVAIGIAAKVIHDMVISYSSTQISPEDKVISDYLKTHKALPSEPEVTEYKSSVKPGEIVTAGKEVLIQSSLVVVPSDKTKAVEIQEKIEIYDAANNKDMISSLAKPVNEKTKKSGAFTNEFKFTPPVGLPQGVYPVKTEVLVNGKAFKPNTSKMQIVLNVDKDRQYSFVALNN